MVEIGTAYVVIAERPVGEGPVPFAFGTMTPIALEDHQSTLARQYKNRQPARPPTRLESDTKLCGQSMRVVLVQAPL